ncbi:MAG: DUF3536 domain-containing protein, partial [Elusimicrobia bacterium]|nr:DUF3536 domain-containing protein [Elusimicrobiota bacterium]MBD3411810.1 DUF3536 domain-containing protein [Elusimicrobiota bacterium]
MNRSVCIHGHFYQPPRENPWLEEVEKQDSASPYHDWNERITAECYAPNTASRILDHERRITQIINNYAHISFNFGPTLLSWLERHSPDILWGIQEADRQSIQRFNGHGSALAQAYNHMIMPLANRRDKITQIRWGIHDFQHRFSRYPEGMWLPETAVDMETLEICADHNIKFTILAPRQAKRIRKIGDKRWRDVSGSRIDPKQPYIINLASGKKISVFFYDGPVSQDIAFSGLLYSGENFAKRLLALFSAHSEQTELAHIATDGETYGHHHIFGDMALAYCLHYIEEKKAARITIYGEFLEQHPPVYEVDIYSNSSWSCVHGVERWKNNCGCNSGMHQNWQQEWRAPLRGALDWLRDNLVSIYEQHSSGILKNPWQARDEYISVILNRSDSNTDQFLHTQSLKQLTDDEKIKLLQLLEMQRHAMLMYTSCGWFFDEISGIETVQILQYAARAMQLCHMATGISFEDTFVNLLERAPSNVPAFETGKKIYEMFVKPSILDLLRVGVHFAVSSLFKDYGEQAEIYTYSITAKQFEKEHIGRHKVGIGSITVKSRITREEQHI